MVAVSLKLIEIDYLLSILKSIKTQSTLDNSLTQSISSKLLKAVKR